MINIALSQDKHTHTKQNYLCENSELFSDIYVTLVSHTNSVTPNNVFLAIASTTVETDDPESELKPALEMLGSIEKKLVFVSDLHEPIDDGTASKVGSGMM